MSEPGVKYRPVMPAPAAPRWTLLLLACALAVTVQGCCCCGGGGSSSAAYPAGTSEELVKAAARGDVQGVHGLLTAGVSPKSFRWSSWASRGGSSLYASEAAVDSGVWEALEPLLVDEEEKTRALRRALLRPNLDLALRLVEKGAKANPAWSFQAYTRALKVRERARAEALVKLLVEQGMDPNATLDAPGTKRPSVLHYVVGQVSYFPRAEEDGGSDSGQGGPAEQDDDTMASWAPEVFVLIARPRLDAVDEDGQTAIMKAASANNQKLVEFLTEQREKASGQGQPPTTPR